MVRVTFRLVNGKGEDYRYEQLPDRTTADLDEMAGIIFDGFEKWMKEKGGDESAQLVGHLLRDNGNNLCPGNAVRI